MKSKLTDTELRLIAELMKNSRRSDREFAKRLGVSQPTVGRMIKRLEEKGAIKQYTVIPDFEMLGFELLSVILTKMKRELTQEEIEEARSQVLSDETTDPSPFLMAMTGTGLNRDRVLLLLSENYATYSKYLDRLKKYPLIDVEEIDGFMISLSGQEHFLPLTLQSLARNIEKKAKSSKEWNKRM